MNIIEGFTLIKTAQAGQIYSNKKVISKGKLKTRVIYKNTIDHSLLNFAIHKESSDSKRSVPIKFNFPSKEETLHVNISSLAKRLKVDRKQILAHHKQADLEDFVNERIAVRDKEIQLELQAKPMRKWKAIVGKQPVNSILQRIRALWSDLIFLIASIPYLRSLIKIGSNRFKKLSEARAAKEYRRAAKKVPAYQEFLKANNAKPQTFNQVPPMDKESYIKNNTLENTLIDGKLPKGGQIDTSTGTTGVPTVWVRSAQERSLNRRVINIIKKEVIGDAIFINAYVLGSLSTGLTVHNALVDKSLLISTGANSEAVLRMIKEFGKNNQKLVITGYPSFMLGFLDYAEAQGVDLTTYNLVAVVGGEGISERARDRLTVNGHFKKVISSYGASDLDINIGFENDFTVGLRKKCLENPLLAKQLFGKKKGSPMIFQYNPLFYYIESNEKGQLLYTSASGRKVSPRVRYNSHDIGMVMTSDELMAKMKDYNIDFELPSNNLPFLFVWGREGISASYYAAKILPEELENAIQEIPDLADQVENYALHTYEDAKAVKRLGFFIELKKDADADTLQDQTEELNEAILDYIREHSFDFKQMDDVAIKNGGDRPTLTIFRNGNGPMANQPAHKKKQYIFEGEKYLP